MICLFTQFQLDAVELRSHVVARKPRDRGDLLVRKLVEPQHHERFERIEPVYQRIQLPQPLAAFGIFVGCAQASRPGAAGPYGGDCGDSTKCRCSARRSDPRRDFWPGLRIRRTPPQVNQHLDSKDRRSRRCPWHRDRPLPTMRRCSGRRSRIHTVWFAVDSLLKLFSH